jgi:hypothetical protein
VPEELTERSLFMSVTLRKRLGVSLLCVLVAAALMLCVFAVSARAETISPEGDPLTYTVQDDGTLSVSACEDGVTDVVIPAEVDGKAVTGITPGAFLGYAGLKSVTFADGSPIKELDYAFVYCPDLETIDWGEGGALRSIRCSFVACTSIESLTIPAGLRVIGEGAFANCPNLKTLTFGSNTDLVTIGAGAFANTVKDETTVPAGMEYLTLPASLQVLSEGAFSGVPVRHFTLEDGCSLTEIPKGFLAAEGAEGRPGTDTELKRSFNFLTGQSTSYSSPYEYTAPQIAKACNVLESIDLGDGNLIARIGEGAFKNQTHLTSVDFGDSAAASLRIDGNAFAAMNNNALQVYDGDDPALNDPVDFVFPANVTYIEATAFRYARLSSVSFPETNSLETLHGAVLGIDGYDGRPDTDPLNLAANCLESVDFGKNNSLKLIGSNSFRNQSHLTSVAFGSGSTAGLVIEDGAFAGAGNNGTLAEDGTDSVLCEGLETVRLPANLTNLAPYAFHMARIKNLVFSEGCRLGSIGGDFLCIEGSDGWPYTDAASVAANSLESFVFEGSSSITTISASSVRNQSHLTTIDFGTPSGDLHIGSQAFIGAGNNAALVAAGYDEKLSDGIETLRFPAALTDLRPHAFYFARIKNVVFSEGCRLGTVPTCFLCIQGSDAHPNTDSVSLAANCLESFVFEGSNSLSFIQDATLRNQSHLKVIDFGTPSGSLTIGSVTFTAAGNNASLVQGGYDNELNEGIETLRFPANLTSIQPTAFRQARIKNVVFSEGCRLTTIPTQFLCVEGSDANPYTDAANLAANCLESFVFEGTTDISRIDSATVRNQSHLKVIDFGTPSGSLNLGAVTFAGAGNNASLVAAGIENELSDGIVTLTLPAALAGMEPTAFHLARVKNLVFSDNSPIEAIPYHFMGVEGADGHAYTDAGVRGADCLETVTLGKNNSFTEIRSCAFKNQTHMKSFDFGTRANGSALVIQADAFAGMEIDTFTIPSYATFNTGAFKKAKIKNLVFGDGFTMTDLENGFMTKDYNDAEDAPVLRTVDFGTGSAVESITYGSFAGCGDLKVLDLSKTKVKTISYGAFNDCGITTLKLPSTLETITEGAFQGLTKMTVLRIDGNNQLTALEGGVFSKCAELTEVDLLSSRITVVGDSLKENPKLRKIVFPAGLQSVEWADTTDEEKCPFYGCSAVNELHFAADDPSGYTFTDGVFQFLGEAGIVYVPEGADKDAYVTSLTAAGLTFAEDKWRIEEDIAPAVSYWYTVTVKPADNGKVEASPAGDVYAGSDVIVTVTPDEGYKLGTLSVKTAYGREVTLTDNGGGKYTFTMPEADVTVEAVFKKDTGFFVDVDADDWFYEPVVWAVGNGITTGTDENHFSPDDPCTRGQTVTFLWRAAGEPEPETKECPFTDVDAGAFYFKAVLWAYEKGITTGTTETTFEPEGTVTRAQAVTFIWRAAGKPAVSAAENPFGDVEEGAWYYDAVIWAVEKGVTNGTSATTFEPGADCLRSQIVTFLYRDAAE